MSSAAPPPGFPSDLEPVRKLGAGGMGEVWHVRDRGVDRALKLATLDADPESVERLAREAEALARLSAHPGILTVHRFVPGPPPGLLLELIEGSDLEVVLKSRRLSLDEALALAARVAEALAFLHANGIVHRDLKAANILMAERGPVLSDFGIARLSDLVTLTQSGAVIGTPFAMSPEQVEGRRVDERSDVWAFGVLLYELVTGERPFTGATSFALLSAILRDEPKAPTELEPALPAGVAELIRACLEKDARRRPADGAALVRALARPDEFAIAKRRRRRRFALGMVAIGGVMIGLALGLGKLGQEWIRRNTEREIQLFEARVADEVEALRMSLLSDLPRVYLDPLADADGEDFRPTSAVRRFRAFVDRCERERAELLDRSEPAKRRIRQSRQILEALESPQLFHDKSRAPPLAFAMARAMRGRTFSEAELRAGGLIEDDLVAILLSRNRIASGELTGPSAAERRAFPPQVVALQTSAIQLAKAFLENSETLEARLDESARLRRLDREGEPARTAMLDRVAAITMPRMEPGRCAELIFELGRRAARPREIGEPLPWKPRPDVWLAALPAERRLAVLEAMVDRVVADDDSPHRFGDHACLSLAAAAFPPEDRRTLLDRISARRLQVLGDYRGPSEGAIAESWPPTPQVVALDLLAAGRLVAYWSARSERREALKEAILGDGARARRRGRMARIFRLVEDLDRLDRIAMPRVSRVLEVWRDERLPLTARVFAMQGLLAVLARSDINTRPDPAVLAEKMPSPAELAGAFRDSRLVDITQSLRHLLSLSRSGLLPKDDFGEVLAAFEAHLALWPAEGQDPVPPRPWLSAMTRETLLSHRVNARLFRLRHAADIGDRAMASRCTEAVITGDVGGRERVEVLFPNRKVLSSSELAELVARVFAIEQEQRGGDVVSRLSDILSFCLTHKVAFDRESWLQELCRKPTRSAEFQAKRLIILARTGRLDLFESAMKLGVPLDEEVIEFLVRYSDSATALTFLNLALERAKRDGGSTAKLEGLRKAVLKAQQNSNPSGRR